MKEWQFYLLLANLNLLLVPLSTNILVRILIIITGALSLYMCHKTHE